MKARIVALVAAVTAAAGTAGAAAWAKRKAEQDEALEQEIFDTVEAEAMAEETTAESTEESTSSAATESDAGDDLTTIKGIGAVSAERLAGIGVTSFAQLAAWTDADIEANGARIKVSAERIRREDWVGQAGEIVGE